MNISNGYLHLPVRAEQQRQATYSPYFCHTHSHQGSRNTHQCRNESLASLGNNINWSKLPSDEVPDYAFINNLEEEVFDLIGTVQSNKTGGTTGHIGLVLTAQEFALVPGATLPFTRSIYPGMVNYNLLTACTTIQ